MHFGRARQERLEINLTPLIDVVFLLLIFFMVSTTFEQHAQLSIELPEASKEATDAEENAITVGIDAKGRYYIEDRPLVNRQFATLKRALLEATRDRESPPIVIRADAQTPHQAVVTVLDAARSLGLLHLSFAARTMQDSKP
jgi:biopolymer transport protein ExbD